MAVEPMDNFTHSDKVRLRVLRMEVIRLKALVSEQDDKINRLNELLGYEQQANHNGYVRIGDKVVPIQVARWMNEYGLPWECFYCQEHEQWHIELDSIFPYGMDNSCHKCG